MEGWPISQCSKNWDDKHKACTAAPRMTISITVAHFYAEFYVTAHPSHSQTSKRPFKTYKPLISNKRQLLFQKINLIPSAFWFVLKINFSLFAILRATITCYLPSPSLIPSVLKTLHICPPSTALSSKCFLPNYYSLQHSILGLFSDFNQEVRASNRAHYKVLYIPCITQLWF